MSLRSLVGLAGALLLAACGSSTETTPDGGSLGKVFTLDVANTGSGGGSVFSNPTGISCGSTCSANFAQGSQVTLTPLARQGSIFTGWSGDCSGNGQTCTVTMSANRSVQANFEVITHPVAVTLSGTGSGTVTSDPAGLSCSSGTCSASFADGASVNLTATPSADSAFGSWSGDCAGVTSNVCTVHSDQARNVGVSFILTAARLTVTVNGNGDGSVDSTPAGITSCSATGGTCAANFTPGTQVTLTAAPGINSTPAFTGCDSTSGNTCTVTVNAATSVTLTYTRPQVALTVTVNGTGSGTVDSTPQGINGCSASGGTCSGNFGEGLDVTLTATPDAASGVTWTGCTSTSGNSCTVNMAAAENVTATFAHVNHTLSVSWTGTGAVSESNLSCTGASCTGSYLQGTAVTLTAAPGAGKTVTWTGCDSTNGNSCTVAMSADKTISAAFNMTLLSIAPADGTTGVALNTSVVLTFSAPINAATATTGTTCANDTILLSSSGGSFSSCRSATLTVSGNQVILKPGTALTLNKLYKIRVTTGLTDTAGDTLAAQFQSAGFTTTTASTFAVSGVTPADGATGVATNSSIAVTFATAADPTTLTTNTTDTTCSGSLQVSRDSFATCVQMTAAPVASGSNTVFTVTPAAALQTQATYQVRVTTAAKDASSNALASTFTSAGFTTTSAASASLTVAVNGAGSGTVSSSPAGITGCSASGGTCTAGFTPGTVVTLTAAPSGGASASFSGCDSVSGNVCTVTVNAATNVTVTFSTAQVALGVTVNGNGTGLIDSNPSGITACSATGGTCNSNFGQGTTVTLTASPDAASVVSWTGCTTSSGNTCTVAMNAAENITATFTQVSHTLTVNLTGVGSVSAPGLTCTGSTCTGTYLQGNTVVLTPSPGGTGETTNWTGCDAISGSNCDVILSADKTVSASFNMTLVSITPADNAPPPVPNTTTIVLNFSSPIDSATASTHTSTITCANATVVLSNSSGSFTSCRTASLAVTGPNQITLTPATTLNPGSKFQVLVRTGLKDLSGNSLVADYTTLGFTVDSAWTVSSINPADSSTGVPTNSTVSVTFNRAAAPATLTAQAANGACSGSFQLSSTSTFSSCIGGTLASADNVTWTFTPAAALTASTLYKVKIPTTTARDANGNALSATYTSAGFTTGTGGTNPTEVSALSATPALQSAQLGWTTPAGSFDHVKAYYRVTGSGTWLAGGQTADNTTATLTVSGLLPDTAYDFRVVTVDGSGTESAGVTTTGTTTFTGTSADFVAAQHLTGLNGSDIWFTWNANELFVGVGAAGGHALAADNDALWIAVDTNAAGSDTGGAQATTYVGGNAIIWPFNADSVVELLLTSASSNAVAVSTVDAGGNRTALPSTVTFRGGASGIDEIKIPNAALGGSSSLRLAFSLAHSGSGDTFDVAPANPNATDVTHYHSSITASVAPGTNAWNVAKTATSADPSVSPLSSAPVLVTLSVDRTAAATGTMKIAGGIAPIDWDTTTSNYALLDDGTHGDATAGDHIYTGVFNFGFQQKNLYFKFVDGTTTEPTFAGPARVHYMTGISEALPTITWSTVYDASHGFTIVFGVTDAAVPGPVELRGGAPELGNWTPGSGAPLTFQSGTFYNAIVNFAANDTVTNPLAWKSGYGDGSWESSPINHSTGNDIVGEASFAWTDGDSSTF